MNTSYENIFQIFLPHQINEFLKKLIYHLKRNTEIRQLAISSYSQLSPIFNQLLSRVISNSSEKGYELPYMAIPESRICKDTAMKILLSTNSNAQGGLRLSQVQVSSG